ncbi:MAG: ComF family protein [Polyangiales bacterium]
MRRYRRMHPLLDGALGLVAPVRCAGCDAPLDAADGLCRVCLLLVERCTGSGAVFIYGGPVADAIQRYKYGGRSELGGSLASMMRAKALQLSGEIDAVVPVPLHWRRRRARGYDQAALLARPIAKALRVPALLRGLRRVRHTPSQVDLSFSERRRNVEHAFAPYRLQGTQRVLLIDDVRTTGATLESASRALRAGGVRRIHTLVLAARLLDGAA